MTKKELSRIYGIERELERYTNELNMLENKSLAKSQEITGMPTGKNNYTDKVGETATKIADLKELIQSRIIVMENESIRIMTFIENVDDLYMRQILFYRYVERDSWYGVAKKVGGSADSVRMAHNNFWKRQKGEQNELR